MKTYSLIEITDKNSIHAKNYSKFKHGSKTQARRMGRDLATGFISVFGGYKVPKDTQIVICSSPYKNIPTATQAMMDYFIGEFNKYLVYKGYLSLQTAKVYRELSYNEDYGLMTAEERLKLISNDQFYVDKEFLENKFVIFMDDVKITGGHQKMIEKLLDEPLPHHIPDFSLKDVVEGAVIIYYAELTNPDVHPNIEHYLNHAFVNNLVDINWIIRNEEFIFNTRVVKYILSKPEQEFQTFINYQSESFGETLLRLALLNSYHLVDEYKNNINYLK